MGYYVVHPGGQRYGPADIATLNAWATEGRLIPTTQLIDASTGAQLLAQDVPGIFFPGGAQTTVLPGPSTGTPLGAYSTPGPQQPIYTPYGGGYPRQSGPLGTSGRPKPSSNITISYVLSAVGLFGVCCCPLIGGLCGLGALGLAAAEKVASPQKTWALIAAGVAIAFNVLMFFGGLFLGHAIGGS